eukprot:scaffold230634_cov36-Tisochrysis_lutea.AAC.2
MKYRKGYTIDGRRARAAMLRATTLGQSSRCACSPLHRALTGATRTRSCVLGVWWHRQAAGLSSSGTPSEPRRVRLAVFMAGLPAAGKSDLAHRRYGGERTCLLDLDDEIRGHPAFDAQNPHRVYYNAAAYDWADNRVEEMFQLALHDSSLSTLIVDGTGTKLSRRLQRMRDARQAGWWVKLLVVSVSLRTAVERNLQRERQVPLRVLARYQQELDFAAATQSIEADEVEVRASHLLTSLAHSAWCHDLLSYRSSAYHADCAPRSFRQVWLNEDFPAFLDGDADFSDSGQREGAAIVGEPRGALAITTGLDPCLLAAALPTPPTNH